MWLQLLKSQNLEKLLKPQFVNGKLNRPKISGKRRNLLKKLFMRAGLPWIYEGPRPAIDTGSPYNNKSEVSRSMKTRRDRIEDIRNNLVKLEDDMKIFRQEQLDNRKYRGLDRDIQGFLQAYVKGRKRQDSNANFRSTTVVGGPVKKGKSSGGAKINRKNRVIRDLTLEDII